MFKRENKRKQSVTELRAAFDTVEVADSDHNTINIPRFGAPNIALRIYLSDDFPSKRPLLMFIGPVSTQHPWIDAFKRVEEDCPPLKNWSRDSSLVRRICPLPTISFTGDSVKIPFTFTSRSS